MDSKIPECHVREENGSHKSQLKIENFPFHGNLMPLKQHVGIKY